MHKTEFILSENDSGRRLDRVIRKFLSDTSLSNIYAAFRKGLIRINGKRMPPHYKTVTGDVLTIATVILPEKAPVISAKRNKRNKQPCQGHNQFIQNIPILLMTNDLLIINKPPCISVHGERSVALLLNNILAGSGQPIGLSFKPGPLHRLDKHTSGVLCFSRTLAGAQWFSRCLQEKTVDKYYIGVVQGRMSARLITTGEGSGSAVTDCRPLGYSAEQDTSLMGFLLVTGKKHQIRKHVMAAGYPLIGDSRYGGIKPLRHCKRYLLHAWRLSFPASRPADIPSFIEAPLFPEMEAFLGRFFPDWKESAHRVLLQDNASRNGYLHIKD